MSQVVQFEETTEDPGWEPWLPKLTPLFQDASKLILKTEELERPHFMLDIVYTSNQNVQKLNKTYRKKDKPTNVLSFPQYESRAEIPLNSPAPLLLGSVVFALETIEEEAKAQNKSFENHCVHLFVHSVLHLLGYDHQLDVEAEMMEQKEIQVLQRMGLPNPYQEDEAILDV